MRATLDFEWSPARQAATLCPTPTSWSPATSGNTIVFEADWLTPGALLISLAPGEFDEETVLRSRSVFVGARSRCSVMTRRASPSILWLPTAGLAARATWRPTCCDVVTGKKAGRNDRRRDHTLRIRRAWPCWKSGIGQWVYRAGQERGDSAPRCRSANTERRCAESEWPAFRHTFERK